MRLPDLVRDLLLGEPPDYPAGPAEARSVDLLGLRVPTIVTVALFYVALVLLLDRSHDLLPRFGPVDPRSLRNQAIERFVAFGILPVVILLLLREDPRRYGLRLGDVRRGAVLLVAATAVTVPALLLVARIPEMRDWYSPSMTTVPDVALTSVMDLLPSEFLLRGFLLFALVRAVGPVGVLVAVVPFAATHIGKPDLETVSTLGGGVVFGWLNWRTGSIWYSGLYHVAIQTTVIVAAAATVG